MDHAARLRVTAPAKVNLYLGIHTAKDARGYHRVDTVMTALGLADTLTFTPADELEVTTVPDAGIPMERHSVYRAALAMGETFGRAADFAITVEKNIPLQSGLGGPSGDAAAAIAGICAYWDVERTDPRVVEVARGIGADVPFFLYGPPAYLAGAGDELVEVFEPAGELPVVLVKPRSGGVSTVEAYRTFDAAPQQLGDLPGMLDAMRSRDRDAIVAGVFNNLASAAIEILPVIGEIRSWLRGQSGVRAAEVSGSGATVFAICETHEDAKRIACRARDLYDWWSCATKMEKSGPKITVC